MSIYDVACVEGFIRLCTDGWERGWHERNGGNLSYRMTEDDVVQCHQDFKLTGHGDHEWHDIGVEAPGLGGEYFIVTGAGRFLRNAASDPAQVFGVVQLDDAGARWRRVWGLSGGGRPTSEFPTHVLNHSAALERPGGANRVIYHAHCPSVIALSTLIDPDARAWANALWRCMTEYVLFFPKGVGVVSWMVAGGAGIAQATAEWMRTVEAVVWTQHGLFASGEGFDAAFGLAEMVEKAAGIYLQARSANGGAEPPHRVSDDQLRQTCAAFGVELDEELL